MRVSNVAGPETMMFLVRCYSARSCCCTDGPGRSGHDLESTDPCGRLSLARRSQMSTPKMDTSTQADGRCAGTHHRTIEILPPSDWCPEDARQSDARVKRISVASIYSCVPHLVSEHLPS